jgi:hypothetical protein
VELKVLKTEDEFRRIKPQLDTLLAALNSIPLPLTHAWLLSWCRAFSSNMEMEFRCAYRAGDLVGFAPLFRTRERYRGIPVKILKLAANGHTPFSDVIVHPDLVGAERNLAFSLLTSVGKDEIGQFFKIHRNGELAKLLVEGPSSENYSGARPRRTGVKPSLKTPVIAIDQSWETFFSTRPRKLKKSLRHKMNRLTRRPEFLIAEEQITATDQPIVQELIDVSAKSWKALIGNDLKSHDDSRLFLFNLIELLGREGAVSAWIARDGGKAIAFELHLVCDGIVYPIKADYDQSYKAFSPGSLLEYSALKRLFDSGSAKQYYTCADDYWYLSNWTPDFVEFCNVECFGSSPRLRALYFLEYQLIPLVKKFIWKQGKTDRVT